MLKYHAPQKDIKLPIEIQSGVAHKSWAKGVGVTGNFISF